MHEGTWTIRACPQGEVTALAEELDIAELTAGVLVRRGYADADAARAFLAGEQPHHEPGERLPDCPIVATRPSAYPFPELCGTGVVFKLAQALLGPDADTLSRHLDLVALATVADLVPLVGENRSLATAGLRTLATT